MCRRHLAELFLDLEPDRHRIDARVLAGEAGQKELAAVLRLDGRTKNVRNLESALIIDTGLLVPSKHSKPPQLRHFSPQFSTEMVEEARVYVNRKIRSFSKLRLIFALSSPV